MIIKSNQINIFLKQKNIFLFYGKGDGLKKEALLDIYKSYSKDNIFKYDEKDILNSSELLYQKIFTKSFFEEKKLILIQYTTEKITKFIDDLTKKNISDTKIILEAKNLEKKSKLRNLFEKTDNIVCVPFYEDTNQSLSAIAHTYCSSKKIKISSEIINIIVERAKGDRINLKNELEKINNLNLTKKQITNIDVLKLTNLSEDYSIAELVDYSLLKNKFKLIKILNENNFAIELLRSRFSV